MSADDWLPCPICKGLPENLRGGFEQFYGKVDRGEYERLKAEYEDKLKTTPVRVDYEYSIHKDGTISLSFFAECDRCHAKWQHQGVVK